MHRACINNVNIKALAICTLEMSKDASLECV